MHRQDREDEPSPPRSRSSSRRNSASLSRRSSIKKEKEVKNSMSSTPNSASSTPKKNTKGQNLDFVVTGKQILKRADRANSLPGTYRRPSMDSPLKTRKPVEPKKVNDRTNTSQSSKSRETSLEDDMSLDLSQVSDFEDTNSKYGIKKFQALATSTPKVVKGKPRSASLQSQIHSQRVETRRALNSLDSTKQTLSYSRDSFKTSSSSSQYRYGTELDYSSVSPEYSGQSSTELSPRASQLDQVVTPRSQDLQVSRLQRPWSQADSSFTRGQLVTTAGVTRSKHQAPISCCVSSWADCSDTDTKVEHRDGEWSSFWANYNNSLAKVPMKNYYDQCPTPYRTENFDLADFGDLEYSDSSRKRSPDHMDTINNIIRNQGLHLTPRETQNIIKCAHLLGNVLSKAIERRTKPADIDDPEILTKKKTMTLDLKETVIPLEIKEEKKCETVTTQTDISLPNTKSAPRIFESILRQLSRSSIDVGKIDIKDGNRNKDEMKNKDELKNKDESKNKDEIKSKDDHKNTEKNVGNPTVNIEKVIENVDVKDVKKQKDIPEEGEEKELKAEETEK